VCWVHIDIAVWRGVVRGGGWSGSIVVRRASIWRGIAADMIPVGVSPAQAMVQAERDARPRRRSVLEDSLSNSGTVFYPIQHEADES
jgi:hypothetical protein